MGLIGGQVMSIRLSILFVALVPAVAVGQTPLPPDINPVTLSRLPPVTKNDLDAEGQKALDARANPATPGPGPGHVTIYSPKVAEAYGALGRALGVPSGQTFPLGNRVYQLVVLITAREIDQQYEWSAHEPAGLRAGLEQSVIDVVKYDRPVDNVTGLAEKDATLIRFFRALFREHKVSSELWAKMIDSFGRQRTIECMALMGDYFIVGTMMNAADQHLPPTRQALLPALKR
jgi:4-carboxymuconolactone decarboxylase